MNNIQKILLSNTLIALILSSLSSMTFAHPALPLDEVNGFQSPMMSSWGGWQRGDVGTVYAGWDIFEANPDAVFSNDSTPDGYVTIAEKQVDVNALPAFTQFGLAPNPAFPGIPEVQVIATAGQGIFRTSTSNWYSFSNTPDYNLVLLADSDHQSLAGAVTIAFQVSILGSDIDETTLELIAVDHDGVAATPAINIPFDSKVTLFTGTTLDGDGNPVPDGAKELLYTWQLNVAQPNYQLHFAALDSSMSLDAIAFDVGSASLMVEQNVPMLPLPALFLFAGLLFGLSTLTKRQCRQIR